MWFREGSEGSRPLQFGYPLVSPPSPNKNAARSRQHHADHNEYVDCGGSGDAAVAHGTAQYYSPHRSSASSSPKALTHEELTSLPLSYKEIRSRRQRLPPSQLQQTHGRSSLVAELMAFVPSLSHSFDCCDEDASVLLSALTTMRMNAELDRRETKIVELEFEIKTLTKRLERCTEEREKLKDDVAEARRKMIAQEQSVKNSIAAMSAGRDSVRKQLLAEELRTEKLTIQNKSLQNEVDKLRNRVHQLMHTTTRASR